MKPPVILRAIIVDDEEPARQLLRQLLEAHPSVQIIGEAYSAASAIELCRALRPDVVFLDVEMPDGDGFSVLPKLEPLPAVIFVTAFNEYAVRAFEINAVDYVLKPPSARRLSAAIHRILFAPKASELSRYAPTDRIFLESDAQIRVAFIPEISGIEAEGNYSRVQLIDGSSVMMRRGLTEWEARLPTSLFVRVARSLIVNTNAVRQVKWGKKDQHLVEIAGFSVPLILGRQAAKRIRQAIRDPKLL